MSGIFGHLNVSDSDRVFNSTVGQRVIYDAAVEYINRVNSELNSVMSVFVDETTSEYKRRYKLPGGGYLQQRQPDGRFQAVKAYGQWDVAFPLRDYGASLAGNDVDMAYMTVAELDRHINTVVAQNVNTVRFELLKALFNNTQETFVDRDWGSLAIEPLANGDSVTYPPVLGSAAEATESHYLESGYAASAISATNNPYTTIKQELEEHFGAAEGGSEVAVFIHPDETPETIVLAGFDPIADPRIRPGNATDLALPLPGTYPGTLLGRAYGVWVIEWRWIPSGWMLGIHLDSPKPLVRRIDPADTGLGDGLQLVAQDNEFPFNTSFWRHRFGFGCGNRLNGVVMEFGTGGSYSIPTAYQ